MEERPRNPRSDPIRGLLLAGFRDASSGTYLANYRSLPGNRDNTAKMKRVHYPFPRGVGQLYDFTEAHIAAVVPLGGEVLDVGCGEGTLVPLLWKAGARHVVAFDISSKIIEVAKERYPGSRYLVGDAEDDQFMRALGRYDLIVVRNTFHHFENKDAFLMRALGLLNRGGTLLLIDLDYESNFSFLGACATHLRFILTHPAWTSLKLISSTRFFLGKAMREHRYHDRRLLTQQGWYTAKGVQRQLKKLYPDISYRRVGDFLGCGGAYIALKRRAEGNP